MKIFLFLCLTLVASVHGMSTFGTAISSSVIQPKEERVLFVRNGTGTMTYFWLTAAFDGHENTRFRFYVDEGKTTSTTLDVTLYMMHGIGFGDTNIWSNANAGKGSKHASVFNTMHIRFASSIRITMQLDDSQTKAQGFYFICRGVDQILPLTLGGVSIPNGGRLVVYKNEDTVLKPLEYIDLFHSAKVDGGKNGGALYMVTQAFKSANLNFLEGCHHGFYADGTNDWGLSSGTEDFYASGWYFDLGGPTEYHFPGAGLTHAYDSNGQLSVYKFLTDDPVVWDQRGFRLNWRNGDTVDPKTGEKCYTPDGTVVGKPQETALTSYAFAYVW